MNNRAPLGGCPDSPNCVSTEAKDRRSHIEPIRLTGNPDRLWPQVVKIVAALPRSVMAETAADYLRAEFKSRWFGFIDDLEIRLNRKDSTLSLRSASRTGYYDFGVNRQRIELLRTALQRKKLAH
ncbi:MAG: DUF1499 domain-containing protein [Desulfobacterales bacterium]|nr:DUF1499 domain-containing protein [Desulfobacterales bacterium]